MWSKEIPTKNFEEFLIQVRLPNKPRGQTLDCPTEQECKTGVLSYPAMTALARIVSTIATPARSSTCP